MTEQHQEQADAISKLQHFSNKHKALYLYAYRVLRPIWHMKITNYAKVGALERQLFNLELLVPALKKLRELHDFVQHYER